MKPIATSPYWRPSGRAAFTLIELLVVIVIIGALAGLMFPMIRSMRGRAEITKCTTNLRGWSVAIHSYATEHSQMIRYRDWEDIGNAYKIYNPYFPSEQILWKEKGTMGVSQGYYRMCPSQNWDGTGNPPRGYLFARPKELNSSGKYAAVDLDTDRKDGHDSYSLARVSRPSQLLLMMDATEDQNIYRTTEYTQYVKPVCIHSDKSMIRHGGGVNALFVDGHIEFLKWPEVDPAKPENTQKVDTWLNLN